MKVPGSFSPGSFPWMLVVHCGARAADILFFLQVSAMITGYSFGRICIDGTWYDRDLKITSAGVVLPGWWRASGHVCSREDVQDLLRDEPDMLVLGQGKPGFMRADSELRRFLDSCGIVLVEQPTARALESFNSVYNQKKVAAGFHLTC